MEDLQIEKIHNVLVKCLTRDYTLLKEMQIYFANQHGVMPTISDAAVLSIRLARKTLLDATTTTTFKHRVPQKIQGEEIIEKIRGLFRPSKKEYLTPTEIAQAVGVSPQNAKFSQAMQTLGFLKKNKRVAGVPKRVYFAEKF